ncbi:hypothetical protein KIPE111705_13970 [Kibdelosporangium persicum]|uniref:DUF1573 domain-containing protein n=1 Tax=Kibdelosporangium persicum TaxID=2698649 RepID=A0ABX2FBI2_9PSEU|nr:hypothetical protein [Kibdelosporangium persicum]NRN68115.1 hypothetical protein [Kibdelosporangium persicum]
MSYAHTPAAHHSVKEDLRNARNFTVLGFLLTLAGTMSGTVITSLLSGSPWLTLFGSVVVTLLAAFGLAGSEAGAATGAKAVMVLLLGGGALIVNFGGFQLLDDIRGKSVSGETQNTFPFTKDAVDPPKPKPVVPQPVAEGAAIGIAESVTCGSPKVGVASMCGEITVRSTGLATLELSGFDDVGGPHAKEFKIVWTSSTCKQSGGSLEPGKSCRVRVQFKPAQSGKRTGELTVRHNAAGGASTVALSGGSTPSTTPRPSSAVTTVPPTTEIGQLTGSRPFAP